MLGIVCLLSLVGLGGCWDVYHNEWKLAPGEVQVLESVNYPEDADPNLQQIWTVTADPGYVLDLKCQDIRLFEKKPCDDYVFVVRDGKDEEELCGALYSYSYVSRGNSLEAELRTGKWGRGFVKCLVRSVKEGESIGVGPVEKPTTEPPSQPSKEDLFSFLEVKSQEIDSTEHGGPTGQKGTTCPCGMANKGQTRSFGGRETKVNEFPFVAGVGHRGTRRMFCGSSIVTPWHAITAAHCTYKDRNHFDLILAEHDSYSQDDTKETQIVPVRRIIEHKDYDQSTLLNDISLMVLEEEIKFNKYISPVCLPNRQLNIENQYIKIIGWGRTENTGGYMSNVLRKVDLRVLPKKTCHLLRPYLVPKGSLTQTCAYGNGKSACSGDSGGPLVWVDPETNRYTLVGIVSYGTTECGSTTPRVSTDATAYLDWIKTKIEETLPGAQTCSKVE